MKNQKKKIILLGSYATSSPDYSKILYLTNILSKITQSNFGVMTEGTNSAGAWLTGFIPHRLPGGKNIEKEIGLNIYDALSKKLKAYILFGTELEYDSIYSKEYIDAIKNAEFVLAFSSFKNQTLLNFSNIILPITTAYENSGSFINVAGMIQTVNSIIQSKNETKNGWTIIKDLANKFGLPGFNYKNEEDILNELKTSLNTDIIKINWEIIPTENIETTIKDEIVILNETCHFSIDPLSRRAKSLQSLNEYKEEKIIKCNSYTYTKIKEKKIKDFILIIDNDISDNCIVINKKHLSYEKNYTSYSLFSNLIKI